MTSYLNLENLETSGLAVTYKQVFHENRRQEAMAKERCRIDASPEPEPEEKNRVDLVQRPRKEDHRQASRDHHATKRTKLETGYDEKGPWGNLSRW
jgi:hypothetical protein